MKVWYEYGNPMPDCHEVHELYFYDRTTVRDVIITTEKEESARAIVDILNKDGEQE
jgi:hypothetical protein